MAASEDPRTAFVEASVGTGSLERAQAILAGHPWLAAADVHTAAILGDADVVERFLARDKAAASARAEPLGWDALTHLCFSRYLRLDTSRSEGFLAAARALLTAGASARTGYFDPSHTPERAWEAALYGAAGLARHAGLTRLLLEAGADPNDDETVYHAPESHDNAVLRELLASERLLPDSLASMLVRKADWHDLEGLRLLLDAGADPNRVTRWGFDALHQAVRRDNALESVRLLLERGADPFVVDRRVRPAPDPPGQSALALAARRGRGDLLRLFALGGAATPADGLLGLVAACALGDARAARALAQEPHTLAALRAEGGQRLGDFAGVGNIAGLRLLLELGVDVQAGYAEDDGYWDIGQASTALHVAAWRARHEAVELLLERGALVDARDGAGRTPLQLAVKACVDSYWTELRKPDSVRALLAAGASAADVPRPSGYAEIDELLKAG